MKGTENYTKIKAVDKKKYNANHVYTISTTDTDRRILTSIHFQKGPIKEQGINGVHHEDLINIVIDRLESFQQSEYACDENQDAIENLEAALADLRSRTIAREERGVEGTSEI